MIERITLNFSHGTYPVFIGAHFLSSPHLFEPFIIDKHVGIITNQTVADFFLDPIKKNLTDYTVKKIILPEGEAFKTFSTVNEIFDVLLEAGYPRSTTLIALGGGVIGDMTGFAAACYQRGVPFIQVPTTLLAQVDASIGGKTAINHPRGKNMIGAFYQPKAVFIDSATLQTLPQVEYISGLAEVVKYALIADKHFYHWLYQNMPLILEKNLQALNFLIKRCCEIKANIVSQDEKEHDLRAILNFGHTFGHALELATEFQMRHGEAVGLGMMIASYLSYLLGRMTLSNYEEVVKLIIKTGLPLEWPLNLTAGQMFNLLATDKKKTAAGLRFILLNDIGSAEIVSDVPEGHIMNAITFVKKNTEKAHK